MLPLNLSHNNQSLLIQSWTHWSWLNRKLLIQQSIIYIFCQQRFRTGHYSNRCGFPPQRYLLRANTVSICHEYSTISKLSSHMTSGQVYLPFITMQGISLQHLHSSQTHFQERVTEAFLFLRTICHLQPSTDPLVSPKILLSSIRFWRLLDVPCEAKRRNSFLALLFPGSLLQQYHIHDVTWHHNQITFGMVSLLQLGSIHFSPLPWT